MKKTINRVLSMIVMLTLLVGILPVNAWAVDHVHDDTCGYSEPSDCTHTHGESCGHAHGDCGYAEAIPRTPCTHDCANGGCALNEDGVTYTCTHTHGECGYSKRTPASACTHTEHTDCGYVPEVPGTACNHSHDTL